MSACSHDRLVRVTIEKACSRTSIQHFRFMALWFFPLAFIGLYREFTLAWLCRLTNIIEIGNNLFPYEPESEERSGEQILVEGAFLKELLKKGEKGRSFVGRAKADQGGNLLENWLRAPLKEIGLKKLIPPPEERTLFRIPF
ncbi:hypothetical protein VNO77_14646 [Canavalia gladiata]|uniref:Uncharacterized protein n=1 Tax=Canavalia gladiata TaxID=3824 RepID=A0AAN9QQV9_CANGL